VPQNAGIELERTVAGRMYTQHAKMSAARIEPISIPPPSIAQAPLRLGYRPSLDGLCAFAVLMVMAHHANIPFCSGGSIGVDIFFVLSSFLITSLLLEEWRKTRDISLRRFYLRRVLRLIPALAVFLIFVQLYGLAVFRGPRLWDTEKAIASVIFYVGNWMQAFHLVTMEGLSHAWSLSIEEQFYLIWPLTLLLLLRSGQNERWILRWLGLAIVLIAVRRGFLWTGEASGDRIYFGGDARSDELLAGCAVAAWLHLATFPREKIRSVVRYLVAPAFVLILAVIVHPLAKKAMYTLGWPAIEAAVSVLIVGLILGIAGPLQKLLELRPAVWIGKLSYGLYLWHFPIVGKVGEWQSLGLLRPVVGFALTFAAASASYYLVELRFLRRKQQFASA
jgi:peptidoglycan/LPS O-acetylase OafA/YrhL